MARGVTILSPHRDDAVFSLALCLSIWSRLNIPLRVMNFFTVSSYAPKLSVQSAAEISFIRQREDRRALARIASQIEVIDKSLLDAPIRLNINEKAVCNPETRALLTCDQIECVAQQMKPLRRDSLVIAPLALADHVDHLAVRAAALRCALRRDLAFYEDLPYATWTSPHMLQARVTDTEYETGIRLRHEVIRMQHALRRKRQLVAAYQSQLTPEEGSAIARWVEQYGGGERIWVPANSSAWMRLLERSHAALRE